MVYRAFLSWVIVSLAWMAILASCTPKSEVNFGAPTSLSTPQTFFTIREETDLIGGPAAQGRVGDVLMENSKIRVIIQKPSKDAGIGSFGGTILDADRQRKGEGKDQWGELFPLINIEWTANYYTYEAFTNGDTKILRAYGVIDPYDFLDLDWIADAASAAIGQQLTFNDMFDDRRDPFNIHPELSDLSPEVITDYILKPGENYVQIETTFNNPSDHPISFPVGDFLAGGGEIQLLIPGLGFAPPLTAQAGQNTPAIIYSAFPSGDVSYGYFYDVTGFLQPKEDPEEETKIYQTSSVSSHGMTGVLLGETFLKILPVGSNVTPEIHFSIPPNSTKTITRYFIVGDGSAGSVMDTGLKILKVPTGKISGEVVLADGTPVEGATVAVKKLGGSTITTYRSDGFGKFSGLLSTGSGVVAKAFGEGEYEVWVDMEGFHEEETHRAGSCTPSQIDLRAGGSESVRCVLGESGFVELVGGVVDGETGSKIPARLTIVGKDNSPETSGTGTFADITLFKKPFGIVDAKLINAQGGIGLTRKNYFHLEPGTYRFVFSHGPEYSIEERIVTLKAGESVEISGVTLQRVLHTPGFISADFHIHALPSPDSFFSVERRALAAVADGLDILQSSDHDFLTDYGPVVTKLVQQGILNPNSVQTVVGDEITPNHYGHLQAFPLVPDMEDVDHGAIDWSAHPLDVIGPGPDYCLSPREISEVVLQDPGEEVIQVNHIADGPTGLPVASGWLTTPVYQEKFGISAFVSYADPIERRLQAPTERSPLPPYNMIEDELIFDTFTAIELTVGPHMHNNSLWESALPTWFNLLNLGLMPTATGDSDSHHEIHVPLGIPRNFVASPIDPRDGYGIGYDSIDEEIYAHNINRRKIVVSAGPYISLTATNEEGVQVGVGDILAGQKITFDVKVEAAEWAWFDTIEIYANTEPLPADDTATKALVDEAATPEQFAAPYHVPRYIYEPVQKFRLIDETLKDWKMEKGKITAHFQWTVTVSEDTWVVVVVRGTQETEGYRSLFPIVPDVLKEGMGEPEEVNPLNLEEFHKSDKVGAPAWAFTNPVFIDVDGDTDDDGNPFEAKWVREGYSTLKPFSQ